MAATYRKTASGGYELYNPLKGWSPAPAGWVPPTTSSTGVTEAPVTKTATTTTSTTSPWINPNTGQPLTQEQIDRSNALQTTQRNGYLEAVAPKITADWAAWLASNPPVTKDNYVAPRDSNGIAPPSVWMTISDGKGGTMQVRSGGAEARAYEAIKERWYDVAEQNAIADRKAAGWTDGVDSRGNPLGTYLINPSGGTKGVAGYNYGRWTSPDAYGGPVTLWDAVARDEGSSNPMRPYQGDVPPGEGGYGSTPGGSTPPPGGTAGGTRPGTTTGGGGAYFPPTGSTYTPPTGSASPFRPQGSFSGPAATSIYGAPEYPTPPGLPGVPGNPLPIPPGQKAMEFQPYGETVGAFSQQRSYGGLPRSTGPWGEMGGYYGGNPYIPTLPSVPGYTPPPTTNPGPVLNGPISSTGQYGLRPAGGYYDPSVTGPINPATGKPYERPNLKPSTPWSPTPLPPIDPTTGKPVTRPNYKPGLPTFGYYTNQEALLAEQAAQAAAIRSTTP